MNKYKNNIYIVGFMGSGKSTVGRELAKLLGRKFIDMDREIEKEEKMKIGEIFDLFGEDYFRQKEYELALKLSQMQNKVVATGGGTILNKKIKEMFLLNGLIICIHADEEVLNERLRNLDRRPTLQSFLPLRDKIRELLKKKGEIYKRISIQLDTTNLTPKQTAEKIVDLLKTRQKILDQLKNQYLEL